MPHTTPCFMRKDRSHNFHKSEKTKEIKHVTEKKKPSKRQCGVLRRKRELTQHKEVSVDHYTILVSLLSTYSPKYNIEMS